MYILSGVAVLLPFKISLLLVTSSLTMFAWAWQSVGETIALTDLTFSSLPSGRLSALLSCFDPNLA